MRNVTPVSEAHAAGYFFAPVARDSKAGFGAWNVRDYSLDEILWHLRKGHNVALKMGRTRGPPVCAVDLDSKSSRLRAKARALGFASDMEVITASGKRHIYGRIPDAITDYRSRIKALDLSWDAKLSGLLLFPPSRIGTEEYRLPRGKQVVPPAELPVFERLGELLVEASNVNRPIANVNVVVNRTRGLVTRVIRHPEKYVLTVESHQGHNGSAGLVRAVCVLRDGGKSSQEAIDYLSNVWNCPPRVTPPWPVEAIVRCVQRHF